MMKFFKSSLTKKLLGIAAFLLVIGVAYFWIDARTSFFPHQADYAIESDSSVHVEREIVVPVFLHGMVVNDLRVVEDEVKRNQRFTDLLSGYHVSPTVMQQLNLLPRKIYDFRKIAAHKKYTLLVDHDSLQTVRALVYEPNPIDYVVFHLKDSLLVESCQRKVDTLERQLSGRIESTLSHTIESMNVSHELTNKFVDIFAWVVDFQRLQKGDQFKLIYEENLVDETPIGVGRILGVYFEHSNNGYYAFPFNQGDGADYLRREWKQFAQGAPKISDRIFANQLALLQKSFSSGSKSFSATFRHRLCSLHRYAHTLCWRWYCGRGPI
ncbi:MAG: hypothetical protein U5K54_16940 [Cytophagales bacterium]|nr:hypothetical protein [Cytophagales bacterium]